MSALNLRPISLVVERFMLDQVVINRYGEPVLDEDTLLLVRPREQIYVGKGFIAPEGGAYRTDLGGEQTATTRFEVAIPAAADMIFPDDEVTCTYSEFNPGMINMVFVVVGEIESTFYTHRRLTCWRKQDAS